MSRGDLTEAEWRVLRDLLPIDAANRGAGRPPEENRSIINGILWRLRCGTPWRDVPPKYGNWTKIYRRFRRWSEAGVHDASELGTMSARDADVRERLKNRRAEIDGLNATVASLRQQLDRGPTSVTPAAVTRFGEVVRQRLIEGDSKARQKIVHALVKTVCVGERIKIEGETDALAQGVAALARAGD